MKQILVLISIVSVCLLESCSKKSSSTDALFVALDSTQTGINFVNKLKENDQMNIVDYLYFYNGGGVGAGDINNDGLTDLFFTSNQGDNKLYLNKGGMKFEDISEKAGVKGFANWKTGITMADVNGDGLLDIYVCAVANFRGLEGSNELYINKGNNTFVEEADKYGLGFTGFSTQAAFFDYDHDGDLDCYLLNAAVHTSRSYERVNTRLLKDNEAGDYLYRNDGGKFKDVSKDAGIYQAAMGYGLGISVADLNQDGWEDIYVSNDFHEDDYYYINQKDGSFKESIKDHFKHLSRFSMGSDAADVNNDGYADVMSLDMYPDDETVEKTSLGEDPYDTYLYKLQFGYFNQYSRNCLQINNLGEKFTDIAAMSGVVATDWSWSTLMADYDNDGHKDIFITNGIVHRPNNLDYIKFVSSDSLFYAKTVSKQLTLEAAQKMPEGKYHNFIFKGNQALTFEDKSDSWGFSEKNVANGAIYADLDNDGDLDLVTNNINEKAGIYQNRANEIEKNNFLKVKLQGEGGNTFGVGAKVFLKYKGELQYQQLMPTRGFQSSVEPVLNFGLGKNTLVDSVVVIWTNQKMQILTNIPANKPLTVKQLNANSDGVAWLNVFTKRGETMFAEMKNPLDFTHKENTYYDFNRESLMPFRVSTEGPAMAVGDVNGDGLEDVYMGGAKFQAGKFFVQNANGKFTSTNEALCLKDSIYEDVDALFFDADNDKDLDLYVVSGGNEFFDNMEQQFDRLYLNDGKGNFSRGLTNLPPMFDNKSCVKPCDFDKDGDIDLFVGGRVVGYHYGKTPNSYLLKNDGKGKFSDVTEQIAPEMRKVGMVTEAVWADLDKDGKQDLTIVGDWMGIKTFKNQKSKFEVIDMGISQNVGLFQSISAGDFDKDGDIDLVVGNLGTNTKFRKNGNDSKLRMYVGDLDKNESTEHILAYNRGDDWFTTAGKDELGKQMPSIINKRFTNYQDFAGKTLDDIFKSSELELAEMKEVNTFASLYLENEGGKSLKIKELPSEAQVSKIFSMYVTDIDSDGNLDVLLGGNIYGVSPYQGRYDGLYGLILHGDGKGNFKAITPTQSGLLIDGEIRKILPFTVAGKKTIAASRNNASPQFFSIKAKK
jgi:enediyne biosynthesis protein E4